MKPRIKFYGGEWVCKLRGLVNGYGMHPASAYYDWQQRNLLC